MTQYAKKKDYTFMLNRLCLWFKLYFFEFSFEVRKKKTTTYSDFKLLHTNQRKVYINIL